MNNKLKSFYRFVNEHQVFHLILEKENRVEEHEDSEKESRPKFGNVNCNGLSYEEFEKKIEKKFLKTIHYMRKLYAKHRKNAKYYISNDIYFFNFLTFPRDVKITKSDTSWTVIANNIQPYQDGLVPDSYIDFINNCIDLMYYYVNKLDEEYTNLRALSGKPRKESMIDHGNQDDTVF